jgi:type I restriction enzyme S subunit
MNVAPLVDITEIIMGQSPPSSTYNTKGKGLPFFQGKADFGDLYPKLRVFCTQPNKIALPNDILISVRAPVGPTNIAQVKSGLGRGLAAIRCGSDIDYTYLLYFLRFYEPHLAQLGKGSTFEAVNREDLERIVVPLQSLEEQKRIARILEAADKLRWQRKYTQELSDGFLQAVFNETFGDVFRNEKNWTTTDVESLCELIVDCPHTTPKYSSKKTQYPCIRTSDVQNGYLDWSTTKYVDEAEYNARIARYRPSYKDVLYTREGERFGFAARTPANVSLCLGQRMMLLKPHPEKATSEFLWAMLNSAGVYWQASKIVGGSTSPHVNVGDIKAFRVVAPPLELQNNFSQAVHKQDRLYRQQQEASRQAEHLFETLLHRAFRGEL